MKRFEGKVALVTGGARNTGLEIVDLFLSEGAKVFDAELRSAILKSAEDSKEE